MSPSQRYALKTVEQWGKNPTIINMKTTTSAAPRAPLTILTGHPRDKQRVVSLQELSRSSPLGTGPLALIHLSSFTQDTQNLPSPLPKLTMMVWKSQSISTVLLLWRRSCMRLDIKRLSSSTQRKRTIRFQSRAKGRPENCGVSTSAKNQSPS